jgi:hypothetical protein
VDFVVKAMRRLTARRRRRVRLEDFLLRPVAHWVGP